jgi:hypothetical protein
MRSSRHRSIARFAEIAFALSIGLLLTTHPADAQTYQVLHAFEADPPGLPSAGFVQVPSP